MAHSRYTPILYRALVLIALFAIGTLSANAHHKQPEVKLDTLLWHDASRNRDVPIALYQDPKLAQSPHSPIVIICHGYNENKGTPYLGYSFIANAMAARGYFVISVQNELPNDSLIPQEGEILKVRRPYWMRCVSNISFVLQTLKSNYPNLDYGHITLLGHSAGGDAVALFATMYPRVVTDIITLDNRRIPLPRDSAIKVLSLRSSDQPADPGVLPSTQEMSAFGMFVRPMKGLLHVDMCDRATDSQKKEMLKSILNFARVNRHLKSAKSY